MPKATGLPPLNLSASRNNGGPTALSPQSAGSPHSPRSAPTTPRLQTAPASMMQQMNSAVENDSRSQNRIGPSSPRITAVPEVPSAPSSPRATQHARDPSKHFFSNLMASKSSHKLNSSDQNLSDAGDKQRARSRASSKDRSLHSIRKQGSTPELPRYNSNTGPHVLHEHSNSTPAAEQAQMLPPRTKTKSKLGGMLARTKTLRLDDSVKYRGPQQQQQQLHLESHPSSQQSYEPPPKTAPIKSDHRERAFGTDSTGSTPRNRSADRHGRSEAMPQRMVQAPNNIPPSHSFREGSTFLSNIQHHGKGVGDRLGKAGKGLFGRITRSGSSNEREIVTDDTYICTTINISLIKQTRKTRIARRLEVSKDKTEFWMPALPWRCIDYLNMNGCEEEGLYRIPGSGKEVKHWQRRFDTELDINLFEEPDLHDINTIGSMFKAWLRDLPDEILPKSVQNKVAQQCAGATRTPQLLKDELSKLPPFHYYLLFAITCHLSLLTSFSEKNKMDYRNLCICFQPCLKIDAFCFQFLVMDWKNCWQGCWTEKEFLDEEYRHEREGSVNESEDLAVDERAVSSSDSSQHHPAPPKTSDGNHHRKGSVPRGKQRSLSTSADNRQSSQNNHHNATTSVPMVPRVVTTPEPQKIPAPDKLPEVGSLSPIRL